MTRVLDEGGLQDLLRTMQSRRFQEPAGWVHPRMRPSNKRRTTVHQMKITLKGVKPPVWRRVVMPSSTPLDEVAQYLLAAMGWTNSHLHAFFIGERRFDMIHPHSEPNELDESQFSLRDVFDSVGSVMRFEYDFGDGWEHDVLLEAVRLATKAESEPMCLTGKRACPPEDCGGPYGYDELIEILEHGPVSERDEERLEWLDDFDPEAFDADEATAWMRTYATYAEWHE